MIPLYRIPQWKGIITGLRIVFDNPKAAKVFLKSFHTACDTRHTINDFNFIRGCYQYFMWTDDLAFLSGQMGRVRTAMRFTMREFDTRAASAFTPPGPATKDAAASAGPPTGRNRSSPARASAATTGTCSPFGGEDALATIYYYDCAAGPGRPRRANRRTPGMGRRHRRRCVRPGRPAPARARR